MEIMHGGVPGNLNYTTGEKEIISNSLKAEEIISFRTILAHSIPFNAWSWFF